MGRHVPHAAAATCPTPRQRAQIEERAGKVQTAVLTDSLVARGAVTALRWFGIDVRAFAPGQQDQALAYISVPERDIELVKRSLDGLNAEVLATAAAERAQGDQTASGR